MAQAMSCDNCGKYAQTTELAGWYSLSLSSWELPRQTGRAVSSDGYVSGSADVCSAECARDWAYKQFGGVEKTVEIFEEVPNGFSVVDLDKRLFWSIEEKRWAMTPYWEKGRVLAFVDEQNRTWYRSTVDSDWRITDSGVFIKENVILRSDLDFHPGGIE